MFYTNVCIDNWNNVAIRGYDSKGKRFDKSIKYKPYLFVNSPEGNKYKTIYGQPVVKMGFDSITDARKYYRENNGISGMPLYGLTSFEYVCLYDMFPGEVDYKEDLISIANIDIETEIIKGLGFPDTSVAEQAITMITISHRGIYYNLSTVDFDVSQYEEYEVRHQRYSNEKEMLRAFIELFKKLDPDIITGWNVIFFDVPYLITRINRVLGQDKANELSPYGKMTVMREMFRGERIEIDVPMGIQVVDYMVIYKKYGTENVESYKLDHVAWIELGIKKLDYSEYENLQELYEKNPQKYSEYNVHDVRLVDLLEAKLKIISLIISQAYDGKLNFTDVMSTVQPWDVKVHNWLMDKNIVVEPKFGDNSALGLVGGYVKPPILGSHKWVVSADLNSLYPSLIRQYNISPETYQGKLDNIPSLESLINGTYDNTEIVEADLSLCTNGTLFSRKTRGFMPSIMDEKYNNRVKYKKLMLEAKQKYEETKSQEWLYKISRYNNLQLTMKTDINGFYGALAQASFRWFKFEFAEAITTSGQLTIRRVEKKINEWLNSLLNSSNKDYVVASDTDSIYIRFDEVVTQLWPKLTDPHVITDKLDIFSKKILEPKLKEIYKELFEQQNAFENHMVMKRENIADSAIFTAAKHYIMNVYDSEGVRYKEPKLKIVGIESVRSSTPEKCRRTIEKCLKVLMNGTEAELQKMIAEFEAEFMKFGWEDVAFPRSCNNIKTYYDSQSIFKSKCPIAVRGALVYNNFIDRNGLTNELEKIQEGDKIKFCYLYPNNPINSNVISLPGGIPKELGIENYIDRATQFEKCFINPISKITTHIGWSPRRVASLDMFMA